MENSQPGRIVKKDEMKNNAAANGSRGLEDDEAATGGDDKNKGILDLPPSWVERLDITKEKFQLRTPSGSKSIKYRNAQVVFCRAAVHPSLMSVGHVRSLRAQGWHGAASDRVREHQESPVAGDSGNL